MLWKIHKKTPKLTLTGSPSDIKCVSFSMDNHNVFAGTDGGSIYGWDLSTSKLTYKLSGHLTTCNFIEFSHEEEDAHLMITGSADTNLRIWDLRSGKSAYTFKNHSKSVNCAKFSPDGNWVASGGSDGATYITDIRTEKVVY